jgi:hypothetical protein
VRGCAWLLFIHDFGTVAHSDATRRHLLMLTKHTFSGILTKSLILVTLVLCLATGCEKVKSALGRATIPDMGPKLPMTIKMEFDPGLTSTRLPYINACNAPFELHIGPELEAVMLEAAGQNFKSVQFAGAAPQGTKPDVIAQIALQQSSLKIQTDGVYDRLPADLRLEAAVAFKDQGGGLIAERIIRTSYRERLLVEPTQHRCDLVSMDAFGQNAAVSLAVQFVREARTLLDPDGTLAATGQAAAPLVAQAPPPPPPVAAPSPTQPGHSPGTPAAAPPLANAPAPSSSVTPVPSLAPPHETGSTPASAEPALSFKATLLDENANSTLEGGEKVRLRVDLVNAGLNPVRGIKVAVTGTLAVVTQFPASTLPAGDLQPGESRSIEFAGTLPQAVQPQQVELVVKASALSGSAVPPPQTFTTSLRRGEPGKAARADLPDDARARVPGSAARPPSRRPAARADDVDDIPAPVEEFQQPQAHLLAVGIGSYRDDQIPGRKFAAQDAELVAGYFQAIGGVPGENVRLLQDRRALRPDIEEAVLDWLPSRVTPESVVIVYYAGQAIIAPSGETFLIPHEGSSTSTSRLYPLKELQAALGKLRTRLTLLIFDGSVMRLGGEGKSKPKGASPAPGPQWEVGSRNIIRLIGTTGLQAGLEPDRLRHGLFTYYLLRGLKGEADEDRDGEVTLGELAAYVADSVPIAAKDFRQDQQPMVIPPLAPTNKRALLPLSRLSNGAAPGGR